MRRVLVIAWLAFSAVVAYSQQSDPTFQWAVTASGHSFYPDIVYKRANGHDIKLDVIAIEPLTVPKGHASLHSRWGMGQR